MRSRRSQGHTAETILGAAADAIDLIDRSRCTLDDCLDRHIPPQYRKTAGHLLFSFYRNRRYIEKMLAQFASRTPEPRVRNLLFAAMTQTRFQTGIASESAVSVAVEAAKKYHADKFVNAILRRFVAASPETVLPPEEVLPPAICRRWAKRFSPEVLTGLADLFREDAVFTFRIEKGTADSDLDFAWEELEVPGLFRFAQADAAEVIRSRALAEGRIYIQDPATAFAPSLPDYSRVKTALDLCAAPGGKSLMIAENLPSDAELTAFDCSELRQKLTEENFRKRGLTHRVLSGDCKKLRGKYDLILADVPCSNTGVFRHRPDALWRFSTGELKKTLQLQRELLECAARLTAPGGQLIYSTCSIEPEENEDMTDEFVKTHPDFELKASHLQLPSRQFDGSSSFLLVRH